MATNPGIGESCMHVGHVGHTKEDIFGTSVVITIGADYITSDL